MIVRHPPFSVGLLAAINAALFAMAAVLHLGVPVGSLVAPLAISVFPVDVIGAIALTVCAIAVWSRSQRAREIAWIANAVALWSIFVGTVEFSLRIDPCTPVTEVHYTVMAMVTFLSLWRLGAWQRGLRWPP